MSRVTIERDGLTLVGDREEPFGEIYDMAILMHGFTANRNTELLRQIADDLRDENDAPSAEVGSPAWAKQIFAKDVAEIDQADALVVVADYVHANVDSGTAFEVGYGYHAHKPLIILQELADEPLNLMIGQAAHYYTQSIASLATYDFTTLPSNEFTGKTF